MDFPSVEMWEKYKMNNPTLDIQANILCLNMMRKSEDLINYFNSFFKGFHMNHEHFSILMILYRDKNKGFHPSELSSKTSTPKASMTFLLDYLEKNNYIKRIHCNYDRRRTIILITDPGTILVEKTMSELFDKIAYLFSDFSKENFDNYMNSLSSIDKKIKNLNSQEK